MIFFGIALFLFFCYFVYQYDRLKIAIVNIREARRNNEKINPEDLNVIGWFVTLIGSALIAYFI
jgi:hypothetical protein